MHTVGSRQYPVLMDEHSSAPVTQKTERGMQQFQGCLPRKLTFVCGGASNNPRIAMSRSTTAVCRQHEDEDVGIVGIVAGGDRLHLPVSNCVVCCTNSSSRRDTCGDDSIIIFSIFHSLSSSARQLVGSSAHRLIARLAWLTHSQSQQLMPAVVIHWTKLMIWLLKCLCEH